MRRNDYINRINDEEFKEIVNSSKGIKEIGLKLGFKHSPGSNSKKKIRERAAKLNVEINA